MSPRRRDRHTPEQLILPPAPAAPKPKRATIPTPEQAAKIAVTRRAKPSAVPGHVRLACSA